MRDARMLEKREPHQDHADTILDILGVDVNTKFSNHVMLYQTAATDTISTGGQSQVQPGATMQISIRDQDVLLYLDRTSVCGEIVISGDSATVLASGAAW